MHESIKRASFDIDGVINMGDYPGVNPSISDVIITGRSFEEAPETTALLKRKGLLDNKLFANPIPFEKKNRHSSGKHKAQTIKKLNKVGYNIVIHYDDDPIQADIIKQMCPEIQVVLLVHNLVEKENVRHPE